MLQCGTDGEEQGDEDIWSTSYLEGLVASSDEFPGRFGGNGKFVFVNGIIDARPVHTSVGDYRVIMWNM